MTKSILILAHPGHELFLHRYMEVHRPRVYILTDGSGSSGPARTEYSRVCVESTGASCGALFGQTSDKSWYEIILRGAHQHMLEVVQTILADAQDCDTVITDPVEGYNPMHDLSAAIAGFVSERLRANSRPQQLLTYALMNELGPAARMVRRLELAEADVARKREAIARYAPLRGELAALESRRTKPIESESLFTAPGIAEWEAACPAILEFEVTGEQRVSRGIYAEAITLKNHLAPIVARLTAGLR
jgi:hypothetical protein